jgi:hypothetical protein
MPTNVISFPTNQPIIQIEISDPGSSAVSDDALGQPDAQYAVEATCESTPCIFPHVPVDVYRVCNNDLGCPKVLLVPVHPIEDADPVNYVENIARVMLVESGRPVFGWRIWTSPLFVVAEFYAMLKTDTGLVDVTPNVRGENYVVFAPDYDIPPDYDYLERPVTRRFSIYEAPTRRQRVATEIAVMGPRRLAAERRRAADLGFTLEDLLSFSLVPDRLETSLDLFIECCEELDAKTMAALDGREVIDVKHLEFMHRRKATLETLVDDAFAEHRAAQLPKRRRGR